MYVGVTNNLARRLSEHDKAGPSTFAGKYNCVNLIYFEEFTDIRNAIKREKEIKKWSRQKKEALIATKNANWDFLNDHFHYK